MTSVTVGIHAHAEPDRLRETLAAVQRSSRHLFDVLLLPDGPNMATNVALAELAHLRQSATQQPLGPPACFNRLAAQTASEVVILLESGTVPAAGALDLLVEALARDRRIGLAGPSTNRAWNEQEVFKNARGDAGAIEGNAREALLRFGSRTRSMAPVHSLGDFCLAVSRRVIEAIGGADEGYGLGPCWEMEYSARAARAGFLGVWVSGSYVWRAPATQRRAVEERRRFEHSRRRYQDSLCGLRLSGIAGPYESHCRGEACEHFAPPDLIRLRRPLTGDTRAQAPSVRPTRARVPQTPTGHPEPATPLVTCVMPTRNRADFAMQAVELFRRQTYPNCELVVIDDGDDGLERRLPQDSSIRYVRAPRGESIGAKRNRACSIAAGEFVVQWDDDDWYGPERLAKQLEPLIAGRAEITGLITPVFFELPEWRFWAVSPLLHARLFVGDVHGGTLAFARRLWEQGVRYPDASLAEDAAFLRAASSRGARLERLDGTGLFVYVRHGANAWRFSCGAHVSRGGWTVTGEPPLPAADRAFYAERSHAPAARASSPHGPLVSCVMPTYNRRPWVAKSIAYFRRQDYPNCELLILDDGEDRVEDLVPDDPRIRYIALERRLVLGEKRNRGCELARGEIIAHWDDDDWQARDRLTYQIGELERHGAAMCGPGRVIFFDPAAERAWQYEYPQAQRAWVAGGAMCFRRSLWSENRFAHVNVGEDTQFVWNPRIGRPLVLDGHCFFAALVHAGNTSRKVTRGSYWRPHAIDDVRSLLGEDYGFYESLTRMGANAQLGGTHVHV